MRQILLTLKKPRTMWCEDGEGNECHIDPHFRELKSGEYEHFKAIRMVETIYTKKPKISWARQLVARLFNLEYPRNGMIARFETSGNAATPIVKALLNLGWSLSEAAILAYDLCEGCFNTLCSYLEGYDYKEDPGTLCSYCEIIRGKKEKQDKDNALEDLALKHLEEFEKSGKPILSFDEVLEEPGLTKEECASLAKNLAETEVGE